MHIIKAFVITSSSEDSLNRVRLKSEGFWNKSELIPSIGGISLVPGNVVYVDVSNMQNPIILGLCDDESSNHVTPVTGSVIFESSSKNRWVVCFVSNGTLSIKSNTGLEIDIKDDTLKLNGVKVDINNGVNGGLLNISAFNNLLNYLKVFAGSINDNTAPTTTVAAKSLLVNLQSIVNVEDIKVKH